MRHKCIISTFYPISFLEKRTYGCLLPCKFQHFIISGSKVRWAMQICTPRNVIGSDLLRNRINVRQAWGQRSKWALWFISWIQGFNFTFNVALLFRNMHQSYNLWQIYTNMDNKSSKTTFIYFSISYNVWVKSIKNHLS